MHWKRISLYHTYYRIPTSLQLERIRLLLYKTLRGDFNCCICSVASFHCTFTKVGFKRNRKLPAFSDNNQRDNGEEALTARRRQAEGRGTLAHLHVHVYMYMSTTRVNIWSLPTNSRNRKITCTYTSHVSAVVCRTISSSATAATWHLLEGGIYIYLRRPCW